MSSDLQQTLHVCMKNTCADVIFAPTNAMHKLILSDLPTDLVLAGLKSLSSELISSVDNNGFHTLFMACRRGDLAVIEWLIENGADVNCQNGKFTPLHMACAEDEQEIVNFLIAKGAQLNLTQEPAVLQAVLNNNLEIIKTLGIDSTWSDSDQWTLLHYAAREGHIETVEYLIEAGVPLNAKTQDGWTALHLVVVNNNLKLTKLLLSKPVQINARTNKLKTPLYLAAKEGHFKIVELLLEISELDLNLSSTKQITPLQIARKKHHLKICNLLLEHKVAQLEKHLSKSL